MREIGSRILCTIMHYFDCLLLFTSSYFAVAVSICFTGQVKSLIIVNNIDNNHYHYYLYEEVGRSKERQGKCMQNIHKYLLNHQTRNLA